MLRYEGPLHMTILTKRIREAVPPGCGFDSQDRYNTPTGRPNRPSLGSEKEKDERPRPFTLTHHPNLFST